MPPTETLDESMRPLSFAMTPYQKCRQQRNELLKVLRELVASGVTQNFPPESSRTLKAKQDAVKTLYEIEDQQCTT